MGKPSGAGNRAIIEAGGQVDFTSQPGHDFFHRRLRLLRGRTRSEIVRPDQRATVA